MAEGIIASPIPLQSGWCTNLATSGTREGTSLRSGSDASYSAATIDGTPANKKQYYYFVRVGYTNPNSHQQSALNDDLESEPDVQCTIFSPDEGYCSATFELLMERNSTDGIAPTATMIFFTGMYQLLNESTINYSRTMEIEILITIHKSTKKIEDISTRSKTWLSKA